MSKKQRKGASRLQQQAQAQAKRVQAANSRATAAPSTSAPASVTPSVRASDTPAPADPMALPPAGAPEMPPSVVSAVYLDVAAVRIQEWLGRTPSLKLRRGASVLLSEATAAGAWADRLPVGVSWNAEAGEVSGVVSLRIDSATEHSTEDAKEDSRQDSGEDSSEDAAEVARPVAVQVVRDLRRRLPHCALQAVAARGVSYAAAYPDLARARRTGHLLVDSPAPPPETVLAKPCDTCRSAPAVHQQIAVVDKALDLCEECLNRRDAAGLTRGSWQERSPLTERRLLSALQGRHPDVVGFSDDFFELATAGQRSLDDAATQLALVYADGNKVGNYLSAVSKIFASGAGKPGGGPVKSDIVRAIDDATRQALVDAVCQTFVEEAPGTGSAVDGTDRLGSRDDARRPPVLVHLADGDDLLVSVPAGDGWRFTRALLAAFDAVMTAADRTAGRSSGLRGVDPPSLSAGVVFHHQSHPFSDVLARAASRLETAKRDTAGEVAAIAFLDLTCDGDRPTLGRPTRTLDQLDEAADLLGRLAAEPQSARAALVALCRQAGAGEGRTSRGDGAETAAAALARRVVDLGSPAVWQVVAGPDPTADRVRDLLLGDAGARDRLRHHLDLARWWPPQPADPAAVPERGATTGRSVAARAAVTARTGGPR